MRAGLPAKEPTILKSWEEGDLYRRLRAQAKGRPRWVLHDGPPYANGNIHIGTGMNKILKDIIVRTRQMSGYDAVYVPGWDCHGLPIEWKVEEGYRAKGLDKDAVPIVDFRQECRDFAQHWIGVQAAEFQSLGVTGDWETPYTTMTYPAEAQIVREIHKFTLSGDLYRGLRPVMWSVVEKTALAEAEVEYYDHKSPTIWVKFPITKPSMPELDGAAVVIWTTTPWTIPCNRAVAASPDIAYSVIEVTAIDDGARATVGERLVFADDLIDDVASAAGISGWERRASVNGADLVGTVTAHPFAALGFDFEVPVLPGDFVTTEQGTGLVHIAPAHGADDFELGRRHGLPLIETMTEDGVYTDHIPYFAGKRVLTADGKPGDANGAVIAALNEGGGLLAKGSLRHNYPHSWRSKAPLIFRATAQWFIPMDRSGLRETALKALSETRFVPEAGRTRLTSMVESRPDWCISRQRAWGVPIAIFVDRKTGEPLRDAAVCERIAAAFEAEGSDAWFTSPPARFLGDDYDPAAYDQVFDIVDVWFESGSTHAFVLEARDDLKWPADLYLEGSDQHRGWFQSSLLESCGTRGRAPYDTVLTHGFVLDEHGRKMSKSLGNVVAPQAVQKKFGADILRLWVVSSDYSEDVKIGDEILKGQTDAYRRFRNTLRYLLGAVNGFDAATEAVDPADMPELERWVLHRLFEMDRLIREAVETFDFHAMSSALHNFCANDLSAFYLDIRKDSLYCDDPADPQRRAARTVMDRVLDHLTTWLAPILCFTAEEVWRTRHGETADSVHLQLYPDVDTAWRDDALAEKWAFVRRLRRVVTGALELERVEKRIGSSLQAHPTVHVTEDLKRRVEGVDLADICITSDLTLTTEPAPEAAYRLDDVAEVAVVPTVAKGEKCARCWKVLPEVAAGSHNDLCNRCTDVVGRQVREAV